ncbi:hypothetical protein TELCIR_11612 [Teladorsagia circumcincta]|uniref:Innexin n=1 Tax=Teladorsagia circumcincta TaxID=45464 RepID=A0A2G9U8R3_TELCI|nr:hypothetical protein TELCIR_11612 [Teladorsagia circumcincta]
MALYYTVSTVIQTINAWLQLDTVLCVLSLNIYYEKLFIFLWFWLLFVAIVSTSNSIYWIGSLCVSTKLSLNSDEKRRRTMDGRRSGPQSDRRRKTATEELQIRLTVDFSCVLTSNPVMNHSDNYATQCSFPE